MSLHLPPSPAFPRLLPPSRAFYHLPPPFLIVAPQVTALLVSSCHELSGFALTGLGLLETELFTQVQSPRTCPPSATFAQASRRVLLS